MKNTIQKVSGIFFIIVIAFVLTNCKSKNDVITAKYVWTDDPESYSGNMGRHQFVCFRYDLELKEEPGKAELNLYASSRYLLKINGANINWGPARNYPEAPEFDTYNIYPYLKKGRNVIAVRVMSNGMNTYQLVKNIGGFIAWGAIEAAGETFDLSTPGNWRCRMDSGYDQAAPKRTFAQGAMDVYDARRGLTDWDKPGIPTAMWTTPAVLKQQDAWGKLTPRSIPFLTQDEVLPRNNIAAYSLKNDEDIYSFRLTIPDGTQEEFNRKPRAFAYTNIYSPSDQVINAGMWWGEHYLNGNGPLKGTQDEGSYRRIDYPLHLKKGWNYFFVKYGIVWAHWDFYMMLPRNKGLILSPDKTTDSEYFMMTAGPYDDKEDSIIKSLPLPVSPEKLPALSQGWKGQKRGNNANNPAIEIVNAVYDKKIDLHPSKVSGITFGGGDGNTVIFDMGKNTYGRIIVEYTASEGTIVDVGWAEEMRNGRILLLKRFGQYMAFRHIARDGYNHFEMSEPNGHRFIQLMVTGNKGSVVIHKIGCIQQNYPMEQVASFECSDRMLNSVWELGKRTIMLCADDVFTDPFRERGLYAGDLLPETTLGYLISGDTKLTRKSMQQIQSLYALQMDPEALKYRRRERDEGGRNIGLLSDFPLITLVNLRWYYRISGDIDFLKSSYPKYKYMMDQAMKLRDEKGIFSERYAFIEWIEIPRPAQLACMQALLAESYEIMSEIAVILGFADDAKKYSKVADESRKALNQFFWDDQKGAFFDGFQGQQKLDHHFPVSSAWPVLYNETTSEREERINAFLTSELDSIGEKARQEKTSPYGGFYVLGALYRMQNAGTAEMFMRKYWTKMILDGDDTAWENFDKESGQSSLSHGWSGGPTWYMSTCILGVQLGFPDATDLTKVTISPQSESLEWARGIVPHPTGTVHVDWKVVGDNLFLNYKAADGVKVDVLPKGRLAGKILWVNSVKIK